MIKKVSFISQAVAENMIPTENMVIISITQPGDSARLDKNWKDVLRLEFDDIDRIHPHVSLLVGTTLFSDEQAEDVFAFLDKNKDVEEIVVHCMAGVSRSAAIAKFIAEKYNVDKFLRTFERYELYNKWVYRKLKYIDELNRTIAG